MLMLAGNVSSPADLTNTDDLLHRDNVAPLVYLNIRNHIRPMLAKNALQALHVEELRFANLAAMYEGPCFAPIFAGQHLSMNAESVITESSLREVSESSSECNAPVNLDI